MNIEWLKNKLGEKFYPITHVGSVLCGDSNETLETKLVAFDKAIGTKANSSDLTDHTGNANNPHNVTAEQTPYDPTESGLSAQNVQDAVDEVNEKVGKNGCGEVAGGKNLLNPNKFLNWVNQYTTGRYLNNEITISPVNVYLYNNFFKFSDTDIDVTLSIKSLTFENGSNPRVCLVNSAGTIIGTVTTDTPSASGLGCGIKIDFTDLPTSITIKELMIEEGSTATPYEPYYPSNKMLAENKADKSEVTTNLLKPTLETNTKNGVTCTNNGDGTYTLNGIATDDFSIELDCVNLNKFMHKTCLLIDCGKAANSSDKRSGLIAKETTTWTWVWANDSNDYKVILDEYYYTKNVSVRIEGVKGDSYNNAIVKPMLTTDLSATYDDFVPFTGTTGKLNSDVAELEKSNKGKMDKENPTGTGAFSMNRKADTTVGENSTTEGNDCTASGNYSHAEGLETNATQERAHAEGYGTNASGYQAHTEGHWTVASGQSSHAEGESTLAQGYETHAEGNGTKAIGNFCHVEGHNTTALSDASHSEGSSTNRAPDSITSSSTNDDIISAWNSSKFSLAKGTHSHVEGCDCLALGDGSHAEGARTKAVGDMSHSGGCSTEATGRSSCAIGEMVSARYDYQTAIGILNHNKEENIFEVGNGISDSTGIEKSNALELTRTGDLAIAGDFYFTDANGNKISMRDILTRLVALEPGFSVDVEG